MRFALAVLLISTLSAASPAVCKAATPTLTSSAANDSIGQRLFAKERASWDLAIKRNAAAYTALHAPDFFTVNGTGVVDRVSSETSAMDANVHFDQCELSEFNIRFVAENAALVTYHVKAAGLDHEKTFQLDSYASSLWMKRNGEWLNVFYQATPASNR